MTWPKLCDTGHAPIAHTEEQCPLCAALRDLDRARRGSTATLPEDPGAPAGSSVAFNRAWHLTGRTGTMPPYRKAKPDAGERP